MNSVEQQLFDLLLSHQLLKEQQRRESLCFLYELFLVHIYKNKKLNEFVQLFLDKGIERVEKKVSENKTKQWFIDLEFKKRSSTIRTIRSSFFKNLSNEMVQLYHLLRDSLTLEHEVYLEKYSYLPEFRDKADIVRFAAGFVYKEDYLWIQCLKIAYQDGFSTKEVVDNISRIVAERSDNSFQDLHKLIPSHVNASVKKGISNHNRKWFERMLPEYLAEDNPFKRSAIFIPSTKPIATQEQKQNERNQQCRAEMKALLVGVVLPQETTVQPVITDDLPPSTSSSTRLPAYRSSKPSLTHVQGDIAEGFKKHKISKSQALEFLRKKQFLQFDSMQDCICSNDGYRAYAVDEATSNEHFFLTAGVLTCTLHAFRLLLVTKTVVSQDSKRYDKLQRLLNLMVKGMSSKWSVDEVLHGLGLNNFLKQPKPTFQSFVTDLVQIETQLLTQFQTISWSTISDSGALTTVIKDLYANYSRIIRKKDQSSVFFLSFSDQPNSDVTIPYIFLQPDVTAKDSSIVDNSRDQPVVLQVVGMVFEHAGNESSGERYFFQFITYSCCREDGQYQVFSVNAYGIISLSVPVPYRRDDLRKAKYTPPSPLHLKPTCRGGGVLVGLILVSNDQQSSNHYPDYLAPPIIRTIKCPTGGDYANLTCYEISKLKTSAWLDDAVIHGAVYMMEAHLLSTHNDNKEPNQQLVRSSIFFESKIKNCNGDKNSGFNTNFPNSSFGVFIINLSQSHWICACVSRKMQRIYIMDSYNDRNMKTCDELNAYFSKYFGWTKFKTVLVVSPYQEDSVSCGLFTIINAIIFLKSIITGDFQKEGPEWGWVSLHITTTDKTLMRHQLCDIFYGNANVDVLLQWIKKMG
jgi:hypothetical protein